MNHSFSNQIKKSVFNLARNYAKIYLTRNLGPVIEDDEKLTCYVKKSKCKRDKYAYIIECHGIGKSDKELADIYQLNKPIYYVMDGLQFEKKKVDIYGVDNCFIEIKNCKFNWGLSLDVAGRCTLEDTFVKSFGLLIMAANEMIIKDMDIRNHLMLSGTSLNVDIIGTQKLDILNSNIGKKHDNITVALSSRNELSLMNSKIAGNGIHCQSKSLRTDANSSFTALDLVTITTDDFHQINITSPAIIYNGNRFTSENESIILEKLLNPLSIKRLEFVNLLKTIKGECEVSNSKKMDEYIDMLNKQTIGEVKIRSLKR